MSTITQLQIKKFEKISKKIIEIPVRQIDYAPTESGSEADIEQTFIWTQKDQHFYFQIPLFETSQDMDELLQYTKVTFTFFIEEKNRSHFENGKFQAAELVVQKTFSIHDFFNHKENIVLSIKYQDGWRRGTIQLLFDEQCNFSVYLPYKTQMLKKSVTQLFK